MITNLYTFGIVSIILILLIIYRNKNNQIEYYKNKYNKLKKRVYS